MFFWFCNKKGCEKRIKSKFENEKKSNSKSKEYFDLDLAIIQELEKSYYSIKLEETKKVGVKKFGLIEGLHYGSNLLIACMGDDEIQEFWQFFNDEKKIILENDQYACKIYHFNSEKQEIMSNNLDFMGDMVNGIT
jgi:hypothetical protein